MADLHRRVLYLENFFYDLRYGARQLRRTPAFTLVAVLTLALGIGAATVVFSWLQAIVLNPLPGVSAAGRLVNIAPTYRGDLRPSTVTYPDFVAMAKLPVFAGVAGTSSSQVLVTVDGKTDWANARVASVSLFSVLGVQPELGRGFLPEEDTGEGGHAVAVISHALWQTRFGGDPRVVGRQFEINQQPFTIVGVTPADFRSVSGGSRTDVWAPLSMHNEVLRYGSYSSHTFTWITPLARLAPGVSLDEAQAALTLLSAQLERSFADSNRGIEYRAYTLWHSPYGAQRLFLDVLLILMTMALAVLLIVVVNVANLLLARATHREAEMAVRRAVGAGQGRLWRQLLTENLLLALLGGTLGVALAGFGAQIFSTLLPANDVGFEYDFHLRAQTAAFALLLAAGTAVVFGLLPALRRAPANLYDALGERGRGGAGGVRNRKLRDALVVCEMALALLLLAGAGLCLRSFQRARQLDLGFDAHNVLLARLTLVPNGYSAEQGKLFDRQLRQRLAAAPGVESVAMVNTPPLGIASTNAASVEVDGFSARTDEERLIAFTIVSPDYFSTLRIPLLAGRDFTAQDDATRPNVAIVNQTMAERYWPKLDPIGREFRMAAGIASQQTFTVIGVARDGKYDALNEPPRPLAYVTYEQRPIASLFMSVLLRTRSEPATYAALVRREIHALDAAVEPQDVETLEDYIQLAFLPIRSATQILVALGAVALALAAMGLYAVLAYTVSRRRHEIGVRMALGAQAGDVHWLFLRQGAALVLIGGAAGLLLSLALAPLAGRFFYVRANDPATLAAVFALLAAVALAAAYLPARRATRVDPVEALRAE